MNKNFLGYVVASKGQSPHPDIQSRIEKNYQKFGILGSN